MILAPLAKQRFYDNNNNPLNKGQLFCYIAGTTTKQTTYSDSAGTPNTNPVILNYRGECDLWLDTTKTYKFVLAPANDTDPPTNAFWSVDNIPGGYGGTINYTQLVYPQTPAELAASVTPVNLYILPGIILRYGNNTIPGTTDMSTARQNAHNQFAAGGAPVYVPAGTYKADTPLAIVATASGAFFHMYGDGYQVSLFTTALDVQHITTTGGDATHFVKAPQLHDIGFINTFPIAANNTGATSFHVTFANSLGARVYNCYFKGNFSDTSSGTDAGILTNHGGLYLSWPGSFGAAFISTIYDNWFDHSQINIQTSDCLVYGNYAWMPTGDYTIRADAPNISIQNNPDIVCGQAHGGVWLTTNASLCKVQSNYFDGNTSPVLSGYGVYGDQQITNQVSSNTFWEIGNAAVWANNPSNWTISTNMFLNCGRNDTGVDCSDIVLNAVSFASQNIVNANMHYQTQTLSGGSKYAVYERNGGANPTANIISADMSSDTASQYATPAIKLASGSSSVISGSRGHGIGAGQAFTGTLTGCTTAPTGSISYNYDGNTIELIFPTITATSNANTCKITGLPAWLTPATSQYNGVGLFNDNGAGTMGFFSIDNTGVIQFNRNDLTAFNVVGNKGVNANSTFRFQRV